VEELKEEDEDVLKTPKYLAHFHSLCGFFDKLPTSFSFPVKSVDLYVVSSAWRYLLDYYLKKLNYRHIPIVMLAEIPYVRRILQYYEVKKSGIILVGGRE
jgi:hypothetical protein